MINILVTWRECSDDEFRDPDRHRKDVQNALILIWQKNVIWRSFCMINILVTLRECSDGRIWSSRQTQKRCPECSDARLARPRMKGLQSEAECMTACKTTSRTLLHIMRSNPDHNPYDLSPLTSYPTQVLCPLNATTLASFLATSLLQLPS